MRVVFMGTPAFARTILEALLKEGYPVVGVVSQPDRPAGRGRRLTAPPVAELARERGISLIQPERPQEPAALETLRSWAPDVIVVAAYGRILPPAVLHIPPKGCLNVHASLLPRYRGPNPVAQAILDGVRETGVTIMLMDEGMDTGPVLAQRAVPVHEDDTTGSLMARLAEEGARLLIETLPAWMAGAIEPQPQDASAATYTRLMRKEDGLVDWSQPAEQIWRHVRACMPWPGAYTYWNGQLLRLLEVRPLRAPLPPDSLPGDIMLVDGWPAVVAGDGLVCLRRLQLAGKNPVDGQAFVRGQRGFVGSRLGAS